MRRSKSIWMLAAMAVATIPVGQAQARDATRLQSAPQATPPAHAIPNPYVPPATDRAGDAYATGFAIGLGTALINKQREDEMKRQREQQGARKP